jgi:hypothetical protein
MKYALSLAFLVLYVANPAHACYVCYPACWGSSCQYQAGVSGYLNCSCLSYCNPPRNCSGTLVRKLPSGSLQVSCTSPAAIYPPIRPLAAEKLPGTIGIDVRTLPNGKVLVDRVLPGSPADRVGLRQGDQLSDMNGVSAASISYDRMIKMNPGELVRVKLIRQGRSFAYDVVAVRLDVLNGNRSQATRQISNRYAGL